MEKYVKRIFLAGALKYLILCHLESSENITGYKILKSIQNKGIDIDAGSLYNSIISLEARKLLEKEPMDKKGAFAYRITTNGKDFLTSYRSLYNKIGVELKNPL